MSMARCECEQEGSIETAMLELNEDQFARWAMLLEQRVGIAVTAQRKAFLSSKIRTRMRALSLDDFEQYYGLVTEAQRGTPEWQKLLELLTIHETRFNRAPESFRLIEEEYLSELLQGSKGDVINIRAWSVGCASGEEAYYLAMLLDRAVQGYSGKAYYGVIGTDISLESLALARDGSYTASRVGDIDEVLRREYLVRHGDEYRVIDHLRQRVAFSQLNVQHLEKTPFEKMDIIFCQNLLIYFSQQKRREIASTLANFLKPGGMLVLGVGELLGWVPAGLEQINAVDTLAYRKTTD